VTEVVEKSALDKYFERVEKQSARFTKIVNWHTNVVQATGDDRLIPNSVDSTYNNVSQMIDAPTEDEPYHQELDVDATLKLMAKVVKYARSLGYEVKKDYDSSDFNVNVKLPKDEWETYHMTMNYYCKRDAVCKAVVVGTKVIPARPAEPPRVENVIEWQCEKVSLLGLPDDDNDDTAES